MAHVMGLSAAIPCTINIHPLILSKLVGSANFHIRCLASFKLQLSQLISLLEMN